MRTHRRGQFEMIGLVFIVVIIVLGIALYLMVIGKDPQQRLIKKAVQAEGSNSFLVALAETEAPACGTKVTVAMLGAACIENTALGQCPAPCDALKDVMQGVTEATYGAQGVKYYLVLEGTSAEVYSRTATGAQECSPTSMNTTTVPTLPIPFRGGSKNMVLALCR